MTTLKQKRALAFRLAKTYLARSTSGLQSINERGVRLTEEDKVALKKLQRTTYVYSACIGMVAVLVVVLPFHFTTFFDAQTFHLGGFTFEFELTYSLYAVAMLFPEIWLLNWIHVRAVREICRICHYPGKDREDYENQLELLTEAGLEMPAKHMALFQIDPFIGLSKFSYYSLFVLNKLKATLSNVLMKLLIRRLLGRYAVRMVTDLLGLPIFAFWNARASHKVMVETRMRIMAYSATYEFMTTFTDQELISVQPYFGRLFHFIAQQKRAYNFALYAFMKEITMRVQKVDLTCAKELSWEEVFCGDEEQNQMLGRMFAFALIVDGSLSVKERLTVRKLESFSWFPYAINELEAALIKYKNGDGIPSLMLNR